MFKEEFENAKRQLEKNFQAEMEEVRFSVISWFQGNFQFEYSTAKIDEFINQKCSSWDYPVYWAGRISTIEKLLEKANETETNSLNKLKVIYEKYNSLWEVLKSEPIEKKQAKIDPLAQYKVRVKTDEEKLTVISVSDWFDCVAGIGDYGKKTHKAQAREYLMSDNSKRYSFWVNCGSCKFGSYVYMLPEDYAVNCEKCNKKIKKVGTI